jgi:hypothetical protein
VRSMAALSEPGSFQMGSMQSGRSDAGLRAKDAGAYAPPPEW